jgi:hypothetical protein
MLWRYVVEGSGGGFEGDAVAHGVELGDVVAHAAFDDDTAVVVVGSEAIEPGKGVSEQVPDDDHYRAGDRDQGFELAAALDDAPLALAQEALSARDRGSGLAERAFQVRVGPCRCARRG